MLIRFSSTFPFCRLRKGGKRKEESACTAPREREGIFNSPGIVKRRLIMPLLLASRVIKLGIILAPELISKLVLFRDEMPIKFLGREVGKKIVYSSLGVEINFKKEPAKRNQIFFPINVYPTCYNVIELASSRDRTNSPVNYSQITTAPSSLKREISNVGLYYFHFEYYTHSSRNMVKIPSSRIIKSRTIVDEGYYREMER